MSLQSPLTTLNFNSFIIIYSFYPEGQLEGGDLNVEVAQLASFVTCSELHLWESTYGLVNTVVLQDDAELLDIFFYPTGIKKI